MRLTAIEARDVRPVKYFSVENLSDVIVLAGPNGVGKTRLVNALVSCFQSPVKNPQITLAIGATSRAEVAEWGKRELNTSDAGDAQRLARTLQKSRRRSNWDSSVVNFESDRSIQQVAPYSFSWDFQDPYTESMQWNFSFGGLRGRSRTPCTQFFGR